MHHFIQNINIRIQMLLLLIQCILSMQPHQSQTIQLKQSAYVDSHTHLLDYPTIADTQQVISNAQKHNVKYIVVNTTTTQQFNPLLTLTQKYQNYIIPGFGIHPYFVQKQQYIQKNRQHLQGQLKIGWFQQLQRVLKHKQRYTVGQIGLDFRKIVLQNNPKDLQMLYFRKQLELAIKLGRPATIHCVRAHGDMLKIFKDINKNIKQQVKPHFIMHSYGGSTDITKSMLKLNNLNIYFSLCLKRSTELCQVIPIQQLICQTDAPCQNNIDLLKQQNKLELNKYYHKVVSQIKQKQKNQQTAINEINKIETNQPVNVIANIKSLVKYYKLDQSKFIKILYENSLRAFKLIK